MRIERRLLLMSFLMAAPLFAAQNQAATRIAFEGCPFTWEAPRLPAPAGGIRTVGSVAELRQVFSRPPSDTTVFIRDGVYELGAVQFELSGTRNLSVRGLSGDPRKVVLKGPGMDRRGRPAVSCFSLRGARNIEFAHLTIRDFTDHGIHCSGETDGVHVYNVIIIDIGQQNFKMNEAHGALVEYSLLGYTERLWGGDYTQGVVVNVGNNCTVRNCVFRNIKAGPGVGSFAGPSILFWCNCRNMKAVGNVLIDCEVGISFGNGPGSRGTSRRGFPPGSADKPYHVVDGLIANNVFVNHDPSRCDAGIIISACKDVLVCNNTVWNPVAGGIDWSIEHRFDCRDIRILNNLLHYGVANREGRKENVLSENNVVLTNAAIFADVAASDLHLVRGAAPVIGRGAAVPDGLSELQSDIDGQARPRTGCDVGADQLGRYSAAARPEAADEKAEPARGESVENLLSRYAEAIRSARKDGARDPGGSAAELERAAESAEGEASGQLSLLARGIRSRGDLTTLAAGRVGEGRRLRILVEVFGQPMRAETVTADAEKVVCLVAGQEMPIPWHTFGARRFAGVVGKVLDETSAAEYLRFAEFAAASGLGKTASEALAQARRAGAEGEKVGAVEALLGALKRAGLLENDL